jgi:hypothetical protein
MKLLAGLPARMRWSALAGLSAAALMALASGGAVALAAPAHPRPAPAVTSKFTWHSFKLMNGWVSASKPSVKTGTPSWALRGGVVYLRGAVKVAATKTSTTFGTLPTYARPAHNLYIQIYTWPEAPGTLYIGSNGLVEAYNGNSSSFASLSGVSYAIAPIKPHKVTLRNGWASSQSDWGTGDPAYAISGGVVYLSGSLKSGAAGSIAFTLPKAARPPHQMFLAVYTNGGTTGTVTIEPDGAVMLGGSDSVNFTSLANISFPVRGAKWHNFKLEDGWKSGFTPFHTATPAYTIINGVVYFTGTMLDPTGTDGLWTTFPKGVRTAADVLTMEVYTDDGTSGSVAVTNDFGLVSSNPFSFARGCTSLAGIAYPQGS